MADVDRDQPSPADGPLENVLGLIMTALKPRQREMSVLRASLCAALALVSMFLLVPRSAGQEAELDPLHACDRAAAKAERDWGLPQGLLAAIGLVESGRADPGTAHLLIWPWAINGGGWGFYAPSKSTAIAAVRALQSRGVRMIDVGCFQVDLFYHPGAFATLDAAFDAEANAQAAAAILSRARLASTGWEEAVALYHSASQPRGAIYSQRVLGLWPRARTRIAWLPIEGSELPPYAALLSPQARLVKVLAPASVYQPQAANLPQILTPAYSPVPARFSGPQVLFLKPVENMPIVIIPNEHSRHRRSPARRL
jgi:hypothetical protein